MKKLIRRLALALFGLGAMSSFALAKDTCGIKTPLDFSSYTCDHTIDGAPVYTGAKGDAIERMILSVDLSAGKMKCFYGKTSGEGTSTVVHTDCYSQYSDLVGEWGNTSGWASAHTKLTKDIADFANLLRPTGIRYNKKSFDDALNTVEMVREINLAEAKTKKGNKEWDADFVAFMNDPANAIESHKHYDKTLSAIIAGVFTIDPDFFDVSKGFINSNGEAEISTDKLMDFEQFVDGDGTIVAWFKSLRGMEVDETTTELTFSSPIDFLDKQIVGYFINIVELLREVYNQIIILFFMVGGIYSIGYYSFRKSLEKYGNEPFQMNKMSFVSSTILALVFFSAPAINDGEMEIAAGFKSNELVTEAKNYSSLAQETVRYMAQSGAYFANLTSDMALQTYLSVIGRKGGFVRMDQGDFNRLKSELINIEIQKRALQAQLNFYSGVCRPYYKKEDGHLFGGDTEAQNEHTNIGKDTHKILPKYKIGAERLSYKACSKLEYQIMVKAETLARRAYSIRSEINMYNDIYNSDGKSAEYYKGLIKIMAFGGNTFGWIWTSSIPVSYFFFDNMDVFVYNNLESLENKEGVFSGMINNQAEKIMYEIEPSIYDSLTDSAEDVAIVIGTFSMVEDSFWFLIPGFHKLFESIENLLNKLHTGAKDSQHYNSENKAAKGLKSSVSAIWKSVKIFSRKAAGKAGTLADNAVDKLPEDNGEMIASRYVGFLLTMVAFYLATIIMAFMISAITIVIISAFMVLKIVLYFLELLMFFVSLPVMGVYYALMSKNGGRNRLAHFSEQTVMVFITPLLIVFVSVMLIPMAMFFKSLFSALMKMMFSVLNEGGTMMQGVYSHKEVAGSLNHDHLLSGLSTSAHKVATLSALNGMTEIFTYFAVMLISLIMIFNYKGWFTKMVGVEGAIDSFREGGSEIRQGAGGKALNPVN